MNLHVTSGNTLVPSLSSARSAIDASPAQIIWLSTTNATNLRASAHDLLQKEQAFVVVNFVVLDVPLGRILLVIADFLVVVTRMIMDCQS